MNATPPSPKPAESPRSLEQELKMAQYAAEVFAKDAQFQGALVGGIFLIGSLIGMYWLYSQSRKETTLQNSLSITVSSGWLWSSVDITYCPPDSIALYDVLVELFVDYDDGQKYFTSRCECLLAGATYTVRIQPGTIRRVRAVVHVGAGERAVKATCVWP